MTFSSKWQISNTIPVAQVFYTLEIKLVGTELFLVSAIRENSFYFNQCDVFSHPQVKNYILWQFYVHLISREDFFKKCTLDNQKGNMS